MELFSDQFLRSRDGKWTRQQKGPKGRQKNIVFLYYVTSGSGILVKNGFGNLVRNWTTKETYRTTANGFLIHDLGKEKKDLEGKNDFK